MGASGGPQWWKQPPDPRPDGGIEESLLRAMDSDPRLGHGAGPARTDNVLDFIQMTGLTTGRIPDARTRTEQENGERPDDPISFFEYGVRDVDGSGDPVEATDPDLDIEAFRIEPPVVSLHESQSLRDLKQIIAEIAEETDPARESYARVAMLDLSPAAPDTIETPDIDIDPDPTPLDVMDAATIALPDAASENASAASPATTAGLAAARDLLRELSQANDAAAEKERVVKSVPSLLKHPVTAQREALPEPEVERDDATGHSHHGLPRRKQRPLLVRWITRVSAVALVALIGYGGYRVYMYHTQTSPAAFHAAESLLDAGRYREASNEFLRLSKRYERFPIAADALFMAGYSLQLEPESPRAAKEDYTEAIALLEKFVSENPGHEKTPRAETLMGLLYFKTGRFLESINLLGSPDRRLRDPGAYLMALRTLGRAYAQLGQMENARSAFLRAAALETNMTPDEDYVELATLYQNVAAHTGDPAQRRRNFQLAVEQWDFAMQVPGLLRTRKADIKLLREAAKSKLEAVPGAVAAGALKPAADAETGVRTLLPEVSSRPAGESPSVDAVATQGKAPK